MHEWIISTDVGTYGAHLPQQDHVHADYLKITEGDDFLEFKTADHKTVYLVASRHVVSVARAQSESIAKPTLS